MRALVFRDTFRYDLAYAEPVPPPGEALIRVRLAGVCNTDLEIGRGYMGFHGVPGHEFVGEVIQAGDRAWIGRRVVGDINAACYRCETCRAGRHTHCPHRTTLGIHGRDGAFADLLCLPEANLYPVPEHVPDEMAVFAEPLAAACEILEQVPLHPTDGVVVLGDGKLGLLVAAVLQQAGVNPTLVGRHGDNLAIASAWGIATCDSSSAIPAGSAGVVVECTGAAAGFGDARRLVRPRGILVLKSTYHGDLTLNMSALVVDEITLMGSRCGPLSVALSLLAEGNVDPRPLISATYPLAEAEVAFAHAARRGALKVLLRPL